MASLSAPAAMAATGAQGVSPGDNAEGSAVPIFDIDIGINPNVTILEDRAGLAQLDQAVSGLEQAIGQQGISGGAIRWKQQMLLLSRCK